MSPLVDLLHPGPSLATVVAALLCLVAVNRGFPPPSIAAWLALSLTLQQFAISLHNDYADRHLDSLAKPRRALPSGRLSARTVLTASLLLAAASLLTALSLGPDEVLLVALGLAAGFLYNAVLKRTALSWLPFALAFPLIPLFGMAALDRWPWYWPFVYAAVPPLAVAIHLWDSLPDLAADRRAGISSFATRLGPHRTRRLAWWLAGASLFIAADLAWLFYLLP